RRPGGEHVCRLCQRHSADPFGPAPSLRVHLGHEERAVGPGPGDYRVEIHCLYQHRRGQPDVDRRRLPFQDRDLPRHPLQLHPGADRVRHLPRVPDPVRPGPPDLLRGRQPRGGAPLRYPLQERADLRLLPVRLHGRHGG
ncbi:DUF2178 domain-containing protein, partial [Dysosmobacter welbionis]